MGTKVKPPDTVNECQYWDDPTFTPTHVYGQIWDVRKGLVPGAQEPPNGKIFKMDQDPGIHCQFYNPGFPGDWTMAFHLQVGGCTLVVFDGTVDKNVYFQGTLAVSPYPPFDIFTNFYQVAFGNWGYAGWGFVYWFSLGSPFIIAFGLENIEDLMVEVFPLDGTSYIVKLCSISLSMNVMFRITQ